MKVRALYRCEVCGFESEDRAKVEACEAIPVRRIQGLEPGELITMGPGMGKGHFTEENLAAGWLLEDPGDPKSTNHHEAGRGGYVKWVVLDICLPSDPRVNTVSSHGAWGHREVVLLYTPHYCCYRNNGPAYCWSSFGENAYDAKHRLGRVSDEDLERYRAAVNGRQASLI